MGGSVRGSILHISQESNTITAEATNKASDIKIMKEEEQDGRKYSAVVLSKTEPNPLTGTTKNSMQQETRPSSYPFKQCL